MFTQDRMEKECDWIEKTISQADSTDHFKISNLRETAASINRLRDQVLHPEQEYPLKARAERNYQHRSSSQKRKTGPSDKGLHHWILNIQPKDCFFCLQDSCSVCKLHHRVQRRPIRLTRVNLNSKPLKISQLTSDQVLQTQFKQIVRKQVHHFGMQI